MSRLKEAAEAHYHANVKSVTVKKPVAVSSRYNVLMSPSEDESEPAMRDEFPTLVCAPEREKKRKMPKMVKPSAVGTSSRPMPSAVGTLATGSYGSRSPSKVGNHVGHQKKIC